MRTRILLTALAACGLWTTAASAQVRMMPMIAPRPVLVPPATAFPGAFVRNTGVSTVVPPLSVPSFNRSGVYPPIPLPINGLSPYWMPPVWVGSSTAYSAAASPATASVATAPTVAPDLTRLEAEAALAIPAPQVPAGESDEAMRVARAAVKVERAQRVLDMLTPARSVTTPAFDFARIRVGTRGWLDMTAQVLRLADQVAVLRLNAPVPEGMEIGVTGGPAPGGKVRLHGEYVADRVVNVDGRDILVLKSAGTDRVDPALAQVASAARFQLESAQSEYADAVAALAAAKKKAVNTAIDQASVEAAKRIRVPDNATGEERIKAKRDQDDLARKLAQPEIEWINAAYGDVPSTDLARR